MSTIDKMQILGIRAFDNRLPETIQFFTPLTLIVGLNGSGKTTIIECLKYATIGEVPTNSDRGRAFIHDPSLVNEKEILAQVRLSFKSTTGAKMVATRNLQLSVRKTAKTLSRTLKALESQLMMIKNGERTSISSRVAELNQVMPQYLGISPAIIEYVIFCHQDDSLWPMAEPAALKKRFDEIFDALKYTKAVENLKILQKKQNEELGKFKIVEQHAKEDKDRGERAEKRSQELYDEIEELRKTANDLEAKVKEASERSQEAWDHAAKFEKIVAKLEGKRIEAEAIHRSVDDLKQNVQLIDETDEQLDDHLQKYEERLALYEKDRDGKKREYNELTKQVDQVRNALGDKQSRLGKYEAELDQYERQIQGRDALIKAAARRHNIRGFDLDITDAQVTDFMERLGKMSRDQNATLERHRNETKEKLYNAQKALSQLNERRSAFNQGKESSKSQIAANDMKISKFQRDLDAIDIDEGRKAALESTIEDTANRLAKAKADFDEARWDEKIRDAETQLRGFEDQKDRLDAEMIEGTRRAGDSARLDFVQKELKDRQRSLDTMTGAHGDRLTQILGHDWEPRTLEQQFHSLVNAKTGEIRETELQRDGCSRELEQLEFKLTNAKTELNQKRQESKRCEGHVREAIEDEPDAFPRTLERLEQNHEVLQSDQSSAKKVHEYYVKAMEILEERNCCRLCRRGFQNQKEIDDFIKVLRKSISSVTSAELDQEMEDTKADLQAAKEAQPKYNTWLSLKEEIPDSEAECQKLEFRREAILAKVEEQDGILQERQGIKRDVESLTKTVQNITRYYTDICNFESQIKELSAKQKESGASRGLEMIQDELKKANESARSVKATSSQLSTQRERGRELINRLEIESRDIKSKLSTAEYQLKEKSNLLTQIADLKSFIAEQRESMRRIDQDIQSLVPQVEQAQAKYDDIARRGDERDNELSAETVKLADSLRQLQSAQQEIHNYADRDPASQLKHTRVEIEGLQNKVRDLEGKRNDITVEVKAIETALRNHDDTKRRIKDNMRLRENERKLEQILQDIAELEQHNAEVDKERYEREGGKWQHKRNTLSAEQASIVGSCKSKDDQLKQLISDWETDYKDAAYKYKEAHIRVETTKAAVLDLQRYGGALDKAIVKYHSLKLEEINRIIEELWKKTYQGTDVDTILVRSENAGESKNRSYNYRVVMVKQDTEMDMRGRCSAGQKVLASIIIRLALAECFGVNCGLIALDEPTTNLDRDNIRALAASLAEIIRVRRLQSNFQLIVITHDEEFLREMQCGDFTDYYYHVSRNEKQNSVIKRQSIADVL